MNQPDCTNLLKRIDLTTPLIGFYDTPETKPFEPFVTPKHCLFSLYENWKKGETAHITKDKFGCMGAGYWLCGIESLPRDRFVMFLADAEGLKSSHDLMNQWLDSTKPYTPQHPNLFIGPLKDDQYEYLKSITFYVNPDQLSSLMTGAQYNSNSDAVPVIAPFGSGCSQLVALFDDIKTPQAVIGATDTAMRNHIPPDIMAFTVTKPMFELLCALDEESFLYKPFWKKLRRSRGLPDID
ncbi:MAG: hypothetical protein HN737_01825 [Desulfobacterales bacterium]|jgi:hypothetical protein|nr:hypothetical protein [Desulfobacteraceae bacterium]MBT4364096.1 hypothetical protein [Desulfobacteraceae bacterium]MBT7085644.1 hypothetical protein [Desulfobacterales bacterium]MBT7696129.1 hypothetical protein [Desulfobacterales bacterium]